MFHVFFRTEYFWHGRLDWDYHSLAAKYVREVCKPLYVRQNHFSTAVRRFQSVVIANLQNCLLAVRKIYAKYDLKLKNEN